MRHISPIKTGLAVGTVIGLWHAIWVILVGIGWAKPVLDFILKLHFLDVQYSLAPYATTTAATLILLTFAIGGLFGVVFALVWNWLGFEAAPRWARDTTIRAPAE